MSVDDVPDEDVTDPYEPDPETVDDDDEADD
jgi:hypothetical protein